MLQILLPVLVLPLFEIVLPLLILHAFEQVLHLLLSMYLLLIRYLSSWALSSLFSLHQLNWLILLMHL